MNEYNWTTLYAAVAKIKYTKANRQKYDLPKEIKKKIIRREESKTKKGKKVKSEN